MSTKYKFNNPEGLYFMSTATVYWIDVFSRRLYKDTVVDSLKYCIDNKGLVVYSYVIMSNHLHLIIGRRSRGPSFSEIICDFKKYTAMKIIQSIRTNPVESRKEWILWMMKNATKENSNNMNFQFWQQDNHTLSREVIDFIHLNYKQKSLLISW